MERTFRFHRWGLNKHRIHPTGVAPVQTQECPRDKLALYFTLLNGTCLLACLRNFTELKASNLVECHSDGNDVRYAICQAKVW